MKQSKSNEILNALQDNGLRNKLLNMVGRDVPQELIPAINSATKSRDPKTLQARALTARIMASGLGADGSFSAHNEQDTWKNFGHSVLDFIKSQKGSRYSDTTLYSSLLERLVCCVSLPIDSAKEHIYSLAAMLISKGATFNFDRLYWDLIHWDDLQSTTKLAWASGFCQLDESIKVS